MIPANSLVFLIDDDASVRRGVSRLLRSAGFKNEAFGSASDFLARDQHAGPACLIVDVRMPELNGMDLQNVLIQRRREEQLVFITGHGDISMCAQAMKAGAVDFLPPNYCNAWSVRWRVLPSNDGATSRKLQPAAFWTC